MCRCSRQRTQSWLGLLTLRAEAGELSAADERKLRSLQRSTEREILQARPWLTGGSLRLGQMATFQQPACTI